MQGSVTRTAGTLNGGGTFNANAGIALSGAVVTTLDAATLNHAAGQTATASGTGALTLVNGAIFNNAGTFLAPTDAGIASGSGNNVFNNTGVFTRNTSLGTFVVATTFKNFGTVNVNSGTLQFNGPVTQSGSGQLNVPSGAAAIFNSSFVNAGNATATATGSATLTFNGPVTNNGMIIVSGGANLIVTGSPFTNNGTLDVITGHFTPPGGFVNNGVFLDASAVKVKTSTLAGTTFTVLIDSYSGHTYQLQRSTSLSGSTFTNIGASQPGATGSALSFVDPATSGAEGFYRILVSP